MSSHKYPRSQLALEADTEALHKVGLDFWCSIGGYQIQVLMSSHRLQGKLASSSFQSDSTGYRVPYEDLKVGATSTLGFVAYEEWVHGFAANIGNTIRLKFQWAIGQIVKNKVWRLLHHLLKKMNI